MTMAPIHHRLNCVGWRVDSPSHTPTTSIPRMVYASHAKTPVVVNVPGTPWWLAMLQIFVPVATALMAAVVAYRFSVRGDREAKFTEARVQIQRQAIEDAQQAVADYWFWGQKAIRAGGISVPDIISGLEQASTQLAVTYSRLQDRQLADDIVDWHSHITSRIASITGSPLSNEGARQLIHAEDGPFLELCDRLGNSLRDLSATPA